MSKKPYDVGFRKPPKSGQFKPGQSGNPNGRPSGTKNLATDLQEELSTQIVVVEGNKEKKISKQRALVKAVSTKALNGNVGAMNTFIRMIEKIIPIENDEIKEKPLSTEDKALMEDFLSRFGINGGNDE